MQLIVNKSNELIRILTALLHSLEGRRKGMYYTKFILPNNAITKNEAITIVGKICSLIIFIA